MPTEEGKTVSVPSMIQQVIEAFNQLNLVAGDILEHALPLAHEVGVCVCVCVCVCACVCAYMYYYNYGVNLLK